MASSYPRWWLERPWAGRFDPGEHVTWRRYRTQQMCGLIVRPRQRPVGTYVVCTDVNGQHLTMAGGMQDLRRMAQHPVVCQCGWNAGLGDTDFARRLRASTPEISIKYDGSAEKLVAQIDVLVGGLCRLCRRADDQRSACAKKTGQPCHLVKQDLCSVCTEDR